MKTTRPDPLLRRLEKLIDKLDKVLFGDLPETPGLIMDVDRLKQAEAQRRWAFRILAGCCLGLIGKTVWTFFFVR